MILPKSAPERVILTILILGLLLFLSNVKIGTQVCDGSEGQMTIDPDGFVATYLIAKCKADANSMEGWEDYTSEINKLHFGDKLKAEVYSNPAFHKEFKAVKTHITTYNPEVGQTDSTPCIAGGTGYNLCEMAAAGIRTIALSQELIDWSSIGKNAPYSKGDVVRLYSDNPQCNGEFVVADAMNIRYRNRGDIFCPTRACNTSCEAVIVPHVQPNPKLQWQANNSIFGSSRP